MIIVQVGTNNGVDSCSNFVISNKDLITEVHLIEPLAACNPHIESIYRDVSNCKIHNIGISDDPRVGEINIYYPTNNPISGHSSSNYEHLTAHQHSNVSHVTVPCYTLERFFEINNITVCDRLYIDTEGLDCKILLDFDYNKYKINYIEFEIIHADGAFKRGEIYNRCVARLRDCGYAVASAGEYNECAIKL